MAQPGNDFDAISISLASPNDVQRWSWGEVTKPETINYRTLRPEKDGLFCERIFGPTKDWECYCGKYKKIRFRGVTCDRCGVEVARSKVRRERMGHIDLAAPVAHIWFSKGTPSRLGLLLDLSPRNLDRVLYFAQYLITDLDVELKGQLLEQLHSNLEERHLEKESRIESAENTLTGEYQSQIEPLQGLLTEENSESEVDDKKSSDEQLETERKIESLQKERDQKIEELIAEINDEYEELFSAIEKEISSLKGLHVTKLLTETQYRDNRDSFPGLFQAGMGAESVLYVLQKHIDLDDLRDELQEEMQSTSGQRRKKAIKRLRVVEAFRKSTNKPEWMILTYLPVLPPDK